MKIPFTAMSVMNFGATFFRGGVAMYFKPDTEHLQKLHSFGYVCISEPSRMWSFFVEMMTDWLADDQER
jgi:hypothetical protein